MNGHYKKDGTYVSGYWKNEPNEYKYDNKNYKTYIPSHQTDYYNKSHYQKQYGKEEGKHYYKQLKESEESSNPVQVNGYYKQNGTYVKPSKRRESQTKKSSIIDVDYYNILVEGSWGRRTSVDRHRTRELFSNAKTP